MYCSSCGAQNPDDARLCRTCGRLIAESHVAGTDTPGVSYPRAWPQGVPDIPNYLVQAILVTIFCCIFTGIPSIIYAAQVNGKIQAGDIDGAFRASKSAKMWAWISFGLGVGYVLFSIAYIFISLLLVTTGE